MKISRIEIKDFHQFQDFELDLTYPKGHAKAGEPLDKVCFIGQSGTGKTTLLKVCKEIAVYAGAFSRIKANTDSVRRLLEPTIFSDFLIELQNNQNFIINKKNVTKFNHFLSNQHSKYVDEVQYIVNTLKDTPIPALYFTLLGDKELEIDREVYKLRSNLRIKEGITVNNIDTLDSWVMVKEDTEDYINEKSKYRIAISKAAEEGNSELIQQKVDELKEWEKVNPNPLEDLAVNFLNPILQEFGLKTKTDFDSLSEAKSINLIDKNGQIVPENVWSTGTKQIIFRTLPLYTIRLSDCLVLIDEPENSLYPNIQTKIIDHYLRLASTCQFFVATHSPIIAASFEPWEIVELKFNGEGNVYRELYYEGENDVNNYFIDPRYYKYGTVLKEIFDLDQEGVDSNFRNKKMMEASRLEAKIKALNKEGKKKDAKVLYAEYKELARKLDWEVNI
ncbi:MAG: AAA family ATPase [Chitinophagales bacterium]